MPSPDPARPGLLIRDPYHYSDATLLIPPSLVPCLECFDGHQTSLDLRSELVRLTGQIQVGDIEKDLFDSLDEAGFLENETYRRLRSEREAEFATESTRAAIFHGSAYPEERSDLASLMSGQIGAASGDRGTIAIAAPHASPDGGWASYRAAYRALPAMTPGEAEERVFVILGTSHYGAPERFGLTRKTFVTPYGETRTDIALVDELERAAAKGIKMEDYCHAVEHSIEFQVVFLQHLYGPNVRILPILCGPFVKSIYEGGLPEEAEGVRQFFDVLGNMAARESKRMTWIVGVDMAHMGRRYGDPLSARANQDGMLGVKERDHQRINQLVKADAQSYWSLVQENQDDLKWCGSAPFYTFLKVAPGLRGSLLEYQQWQIDQDSVVSFAAMSFRDGDVL